MSDRSGRDFDGWRDELIGRLLDLAIDEDLGDGDATTRALFPAPGKSRGRFAARVPGVMAGGGGDPPPV